ncbi:MAG: tyrosine-type recombinase/integrase [Roseburia hominis]
MLKRLHIILERAGCKRIRFHDLRHTFATLSLENGMDVKTLSAMLGHVSAATTLDIYTHVTGDMQSEAAAKIDRGLGNEIPEEPVQAEQDLGCETSSQCWDEDAEARHRVHHANQRPPV